MDIHGLRHESFSAYVSAPPPALFTFLDDPRNLSRHMEKRSWMMMGSTMAIEADARGGREVGSLIRMRARVLGVELGLEEVVTVREARRKAWETIGTPRLLVIGRYRMGFEIEPRERDSLLTVSIDYEPRPLLPFGWLGPAYARWCTRRMGLDAAAHFRRREGRGAIAPDPGG